MKRSAHILAHIVGSSPNGASRRSQVIAQEPAPVPDSAMALDAADCVGACPIVNGIEPPKGARIAVPPVEESVDVTS